MTFVAGTFGSLDGDVHFTLVGLHAAIYSAMDVLRNWIRLQDRWTSDLLPLLAVVKF